MSTELNAYMAILEDDIKNLTDIICDLTDVDELEIPKLTEERDRKQEVLIVLERIVSAGKNNLEIDNSTGKIKKCPLCNFIMCYEFKMNNYTYVYSCNCGYALTFNPDKNAWFE